MTTIDKTRSQTFQQITTQQDIKDILNQPNVTFKNNKGKDKQRHGGLTIKFSSDTSEESSLTTIHDDLSENETFYDTYDTVDDLHNISTEEISQFQTTTKEVATQTETSKEKSTDNFTKSYNAITIFENKKIEKLRKTIFNLKEEILSIEENNKELFKKNIKKNYDWKIKFKELSNLKTEIMKIELEIKNKINFDNNLSSKKYLLKNNIKNIEKEILAIENQKQYLIKKEVHKNNNEINKFESNIHQLNQKLDKYINELSIPTTPSALWIKKSDEVAELHKKMKKVTTDKEFYKIRKKIEKINNKMIKKWDGKKVEQIYEEILPINNELYFITTLVHIDNSITEEVIYFQEDSNGFIKIFKQNKQYDNINEYKKDFLLCENQLHNKSNVNIKTITIKNFLKIQYNFKLKPTKTEISIWSASWLIPIILIVIGLIHPPLFIVGVGFGIVGLILKGVASFLDPWTKKVESQIRQNFSSLIRKISFLNEKLSKTKKELEIKNNIKKL